jgi:ParB family chromosome partitioning protein
VVERKKRGLGRGLGALIPDANSNDRPVDVFFSGGSTEDGKRDGETKTSRTARTDPAASMQSSRRRKPKATGTTRSTSTATETGTDTKASASKTSSSKSTAAKSGTAKAGSSATTQSKSIGTKAAPSKSTGTKSATTKSSSAKTTASKPAGTKSNASKTPSSKSSTSKTTNAKTSTAKTPETKTSVSTAKPSTAKSSTSKTDGGNASKPASAAKSTPPKAKAGSSTASTAESTEKASAAAKTSTRSTSSSVPASDSAINASEAESLESNEAVASAPSVEDDVRETHPGVYTSSGRDQDDVESDEKSTPEHPDDQDRNTTAVVADDADAAEDEIRSSAASVPESSSVVADFSEDGTTSSSMEEPSDSDTSEDDEDSDSGEIDGVESIPDTEFGEIDVDLIDANPRQPRTVFDEDLLAELVHSIREIGVLQPVVVRQKPSDHSRFELIMGERRLRATKDAGLSTIPAIIRYVEDTDLLRDALLENLHRAELNPLEEAAAYGQLLEDFGCTQEELSERIGRSRPQISNTLRLLRLPPLVQRRVAAGVISAGHARAILGLRDPEHMEVLAQRIVAEGLSVRASEEAVVLLNRGDSINVSRATTKVAPEFLAVAERLGDRLDTKVNISVGKRKGKLSVEFANQEDLDRILGLLGISNEESL